MKFNIENDKIDTLINNENPRSMLIEARKLYTSLTEVNYDFDKLVDLYRLTKAMESIDEVLPKKYASEVRKFKHLTHSIDINIK